MSLYRHYRVLQHAYVLETRLFHRLTGITMDLALVPAGALRAGDTEASPGHMKPNTGVAVEVDAANTQQTIVIRGPISIARAMPQREFAA